MLSIVSKEPELDQAIDMASSDGSVRRMGRVELSILRLALYEIRYDDMVACGRGHK